MLGIISTLIVLLVLGFFVLTIAFKCKDHFTSIPKEHFRCRECFTSVSSENDQDDSTHEQNIFEMLMNDFEKIFTDGNRNSGGAQFFHHIVHTIKPTKAQFDTLNKHYCAVSGSPIDPSRGDRASLLIMKDIHGSEICGTFYKCCSPCNCDIMKYARVEKMSLELSDGPHEFYAIVIDDPCTHPEAIPNSVTSFKCIANRTSNATLSPSGRLIMGVLHNASQCTQTDRQVVDNQNGEYCQHRYDQENTPEGVQSGMGDIFIRLSQAGGLKNVYGQPLKACRGDEHDSNGSWDANGYCSERGGGVHQICFDVTPERQDFSTHTGQSDWSKTRVGKNHCMCLGAWSLYKAKQAKGFIPETTDELNCEAIPAMSLSNHYVKNWNTWNGNELDNQVVDGVNSLMDQCYVKAPNLEQAEYIKDLYSNLTSKRREFHKTNTYKKVHSS